MSPSRGPAPVIVRPIEDRRIATRILVDHAHMDGPPAGMRRPTPLQWECIAEEASRHRIGPLAWRILSRGPLADAMPESISERLKSLFIRNAFRNAILARETAAAANALAEHDIPVILLKGMHLTHFVYDEPALRSMADIDIMVPRDRLADAERIFVGMDYGPHPRPDLEAHCAWSNHLAALEKDGAEVLEVHYAIERPGSPFPIDHDAIWARSEIRDMAGAQVRLLAPEHLVIHLCLHLAYHHRFDRAALKGLIDVATVVRRHRADIDWEELARTADAWEVSPFARMTLRLAKTMLGADVPDAVLDRLGSSPDDIAVADRIERFVLTPAVDLGAGIEHARRAGMAGLARGVFLPPDQMRSMYGLPPGSMRVWPWYLVRVADLIRRRGALLLRVVARTPALSPTLDREHDRLDIERWALHAADPKRS